MTNRRLLGSWSGLRGAWGVSGKGGEGRGAGRQGRGRRAGAYIGDGHGILWRELAKADDARPNDATLASVTGRRLPANPIVADLVPPSNCHIRPPESPGPASCALLGKLK